MNVAPANATGTVQIKDGATPIGRPVPVFGGFALLIDALPKGAHSLTAVFTPTNSAALPIDITTGVADGQVAVLSEVITI